MNRKLSECKIGDRIYLSHKLSEIIKVYHCEYVDCTSLVYLVYSINEDTYKEYIIDFENPEVY